MLVQLRRAAIVSCALLSPELGPVRECGQRGAGAGALAVWPSDATASPLFAQGPKDKDGKPTAPANPQSLNRYSYVENNPVSKNDPSGHCSGGSAWNNFVSIFNGTCFQKGMFIMAHARTPGDWALGAFAAVGPSAAVALLTAGTFGLGAVAIAGSGLTTTATTTTAAAPLAKFADYLFREGGPEDKRHVFESLGYDIGDSAQLVKMYQEQAAVKFAQGAYTYGKLDKWGQRIDIEIELPGIREAAGKTFFRSQNEKTFDTRDFIRGGPMVASTA